MDSIHDLGGKQGHGHVDVNEPEVPFHHDWEGRMWAISRTVRAPDWTIDWWRHVRENIDPVDYLARPYFDQWMQTYSVAYVLSGMFTPEEIISGKSSVLADPAPVQNLDQVLTTIRNAAISYERPTNTLPRFQAGDQVTTTSHTHSGHTRLPQYARGKSGVINAHRGNHAFPDAEAAGREEAQHLYTVGFSGRELWGEEGHASDMIYLDLWESYFE